MCPDADLLSAWKDGEVPAPWAERIASHVAACQNCASRVARWEELSARVRGEGRAAEVTMVARVRERLEASIEASRKVTPGPGLRRHLSLPLPLAAAAALALILIGGLSGGLLAGSTSSSIARNASNGPGLASLSSSSPNMDSLVRYLEAQNAQVSVTIQLPQGAAFSSSGEPMIVKTPPLEAVSWPPAANGPASTGTGTR